MFVMRGTPSAVSYVPEPAGRDAAGILHRRTQATGRIRVESTEQLHSSAIVDFAETAANDSLVPFAEYFSQPTALGTGRISDGDAGREIRLFKVVKTWPVIGRSAEDERNQRRGAVSIYMPCFMILDQLLLELAVRRGSRWQSETPGIR